MATAADFRGADEEGTAEDFRAFLEARGKVGLGLDRDFGMREI